MTFTKQLIIIIIITLLWIRCQGGEKQIQETEAFPVTQVGWQDTSSHTDYVAEIHAIQNVEIRARVGGYLEKIYIDEGKFVAEGQVLFSINAVEYQQELARAKALYKSSLAEMKSAQLGLKNAEQLFRGNVISITELEIAKNKLEAAKASVEEAQAQVAQSENKLNFTTVKAPFSGITNKIPYKPGSLIEVGSLLTTLSDNREIFAYFDVSEKEYLAYAKNALKDSSGSRIVGLVLADGSLHHSPGKIETIEGEIDGETGNIAFRARFKNPDRLLKHGASGKVRLTKKFENVLLVPQKATYEIQDRIFVYVVAKDGTIQSRGITISQRIPHFFIVSQGLNNGDTILLEGIQNVRDGQKIKPEMVPFAAVKRSFSPS